MSLLYKDKDDVQMEVCIGLKEGNVVLDFSSDCGKFGTNEMLDGYTLTPERLLQILQDREDITDEENDS